MRRFSFGFICLLWFPSVSFSQSVDATRITVRVTPGIVSSRQLPSPALVAARRALAAGQPVPFSQMQALADLGDGFAALRLAQTLEARGSAITASDVAHYYGVAAATGRGGAFNGLVRTLDQIDYDDLSDGRRTVLKDIIVAYTLAGNSRALNAVLRYNLRQEPFGALDEELDSVLIGATGEGAAQLALQLAISIMRDPNSSTEKLLTAEIYIEIARTATDFQTQMMVGNIFTLLEDELQSRPDLETARLALASTELSSETNASKIRPVSRPEARPAPRPAILEEVIQ